ncbi:hypothetical protein GCM10011390_20690 [Aureimonas endophytica]|uniref:Uncharacterized protein n=1 Tax=Aureimonas endophytica TaxID=2027858 RepID=A0A916ZK06_9HYPH|nr:hypothetical protein [Aureimonas endophytica]GGE01658.1 hypothetical protein GCM10011390_20690 [Aureimonas endophytica]
MEVELTHDADVNRMNGHNRIANDVEIIGKCVPKHVLNVRDMADIRDRMEIEERQARGDIGNG